MQHELQPDSLVDLKFIMPILASVKPSSTTGLSPATCQKPKLSTGEQDGYIVTIVNSKISS